jgi:glycosyltransferase involved in cell wall biosynthesis
MAKYKVALVHDYLREYGGAERVLEVIHDIWPEAPLYTAYYNPEKLGPNAKNFANWDIRTSWMQKVPFANKLLSPFRIFAPLMFESFNLSDYDLVVSSSSAVYFAKSVITKPETLHISYIHTPPRFLYGYTTSFNYKKHWWTRLGGELINHYLRIYDFEVSQRPDVLVGNSKNIQARIKKFYRRDSEVIYPPIDLTEFTGKKEEGKYLLALNRLVRGKGTEVIVEAATQLNLPLKVAGTGPELDRLKALAGPTIEFLGWVSDTDRIKLLQEAKVLIVSSEDEDFGITPVEAQAAGTPVIAIKAGGYLETVIPETGVFFDGSVDDLVKVLGEFKVEGFKVADLRKNAERFSTERFKKEILALVDKHLKKAH